MMDQMIRRFPGQVKEALEIGRNAQLRQPGKVAQVLVAGLGGSGIGGQFVAEFVRDHCRVPYLVSKGYDIPAWVGPETVALVSSYSGNTEETLSALELLERAGAHIIAITSGGQLLEKAKVAGWDHVALPDQWSSPRACLGYSIVQQMVVLERFGLIPSLLLDALGQAASLLEQEQEDIRRWASRIADLMVGKTPVIYTTDRMEAVAVRFRQQLNENAKVLCWHHVIPEMNHNELVGWRDRRDDLAVILLRNRDDHPRNQLRCDLVKEIVSHYTGTFIEVYSQGDGLIGQAFYFIHLGDWVSWHLAEHRGVDAVEVRVIDFLKGELSREHV